MIARFVCWLAGHGPEVRSNGKPLGSTSPYRNDYIYVYCARCKRELRRFRDW